MKGPTSLVRLQDTGIVVIGRNEGERLRRCLATCLPQVRRVVYADSGSSDGSVDLARELGANVVELDMSIPGNAARGRNAGLEALLAAEPRLAYCLFIDGDCELVEGFLERAREAFEGDARLGIVCGRRSELRPQDSLYNRLVDCEWNTPVGPLDAAGGDALVGVSAFRAAGGYDENMSCGEDPEFSYRVRRAGYGILRIDADMTRHDVALERFAAWWKRHGRGGYAYAHGCALHWREPERFNLKICLSIVTYGLALPVVALASLPWLGAHASWMVLAYVRLAWRLASHRRAQGDAFGPSILYAAFIVPGKFAECFNLLQCARDLVFRRRSLVLEYKDYQRKEAA